MAGKRVSRAELEVACGEYGRAERRDPLYRMAMDLVGAGFDVEAMVLILSTWNFATFRYALKTFDFDGFRKLVRKAGPVFRRLEGQRFESADLDKLEKDIKILYRMFSKVDGVKYTGTPKVLHLRNPGLFVMWDARIKNEYRVKGNTAEDYVLFLRKMQDVFGDIKWKGKQTLAKAVDEYNYVKFTLPEL